MRRQLPQQSALSGTHRPVDDVERGCPAAHAVSDDDARTSRCDRQLLVFAQELLRLVLGALVGVTELLAGIEVVLTEASAVAPADVGGGHVHDPTQRSVACGL